MIFHLTRVTPWVTFTIMIRSFKHKGLEEYFYSGSKKGIQPTHAKKLGRILDRLAASKKPTDMNLPGYGFHGLQGELDGYYAVSVSGNWRVLFTFDGENAIDVNYIDYH